MATPTIVLINDGGLTDGVLSDADTNTGWNDLTTADADIKVEGTASMSGVFRASGDTGYYDAASAPTSGADRILRGWVFTNNLPYMEDEAGGGYSLYVYDGTNETTKHVMFGSDTYPGGWFYFWMAMASFIPAPSYNQSLVERWGIYGYHHTSAKNAVNTWMDVLRYMDGYYMTGGTSGDKIDIIDVAVTDKTSAYGIIQESRGVYFGTGTVQVGNGATTTWFEMDGEVLVFLAMPGDLRISEGLYLIDVTGSGCDAVITNCVLRSAGTTNTTRFTLDFSDSDATVDFSNNSVLFASTIGFHSGMTATSNTFDDCRQITHAGANMNGCTAKNYEGTAGTAALLYNVNTDPDGEMDDMTFVKGTAATHAIEFGSTAPSAVTLRDQIYTGYNAAHGNNDSTFYNNTGGALTINIVGGSGNVTYRNGTSATTTIVADPVALSIHAQDISTQADISGAQAFVYVTSTAGGYPYQASVTITRSGTTATVTHTGHGLSTNDNAFIEGATDGLYNGCYQITVTTDDAYTYTMNGTPAADASGTITSTFAVIMDTTDVNGDTSVSYAYSSNQPISGRVRYAGYRTGAISGEIDNTAGRAITLNLVPD
jgi:hypothetical protein